MTAITKSSYFLSLAVLMFSAISPLAIALPQPLALNAPDSLSLVVIKMTGEEFILIKNNSLADIEDLSRYSLKAFNNFNPMVTNATVSTQTLPTFGLGKGELIMLSSTIRPTCGASLAGKLAVSLVDSSGRLEIIKSPLSGSADTTEIIDSVSWSSGLSGDIKSLPSNSKAPLSAFFRTLNADTYTWQLANLDPIKSCLLTVNLPGNTGENLVEIIPDGNYELPDLAVQVSVNKDTQVNDGTTSNLKLVYISELLPNPKGSGNDSVEEYIEVYNPNETDFDLSGFQLQTGISKLYNFTFKEGVNLPAKSYKSFTSAVTGLTLSNALGQARLLTPDGESISATEVYRSARDGQSWSIFDGIWRWSETSTPDLPNSLSIPMTPDKKPLSSVANSTIKTVREATAKKVKPPKSHKVSKTKKPKKIITEKTTKTSSLPDTQTLMERPIQTKLVATVGSVALLYGAYEYRSSLANAYYRFRRKFGLGGSDRS